MLRLLCLVAFLRALPVSAEATLLSSYDWQMDDPLFGGFSAIEVTADGRRFVALTDRASVARGTIRRDGDKITGIDLEIFRRLLGPTRAPLSGVYSDSEGLAIGADGRLFVSFESQHGLRRFDDVDRPGTVLATTQAFADLQHNSSLEALAIGADGALYTLPERSGLATRPFPVYRLQDSVWDIPFHIPRRGAFLISGADIGPDGLFYVLERDFVGVGFRSRVRRFALDGTDEELILQTGVRTHDNLEGISVWQSASGLRMTLISDDNFRGFQQTQIVEYRLTD